MGCDWQIPAQFTQISDREFRFDNSKANQHRELSSILFGDSFNPNHFEVLSQIYGANIFAFRHQSNPGFDITSVFTRSRHLSTNELISDIITIRSGDQYTSLIGLTDKEASLFLTNCVDVTVIDKHQSVLKQLQQNFTEFKSGSHQLEVILPSSSNQ
ncbi:hypothetical protein Q3O60_06935 [Alkalimonas collagenimarina]|uniref:Uncharacterized protein n=1 Tax=Alkalimonas collagenimarina TaxID=400390 RepID=A0ABT9GXZ6_9GAMM|nr:hypothetical protein [Alkalimonas collagenimarina]MDP4535916.1 hypothetical protein [Alkalimonas collagenimarina]